MSRRALIALLGLAAAVSAHAQEPPPIDVRQVQVQVWISETGERGLRDLGANLQYFRQVDGVSQGGSVQQINTNVHDLRDPAFTVTLPAPDQDRFNPPMRPDQEGGLAGGIQTQEGVGLTFTLIEDDYGTINGAFRAVEQTSDLDLISKPELLVMNDHEAAIHAGGEVPYQSIEYDNSGNPRLDVKFESIGVNMVLLPSIQPDGMIMLDIKTLDVTEIVRIDNVRGIDLPVFSTRAQTGQVLVPDGQTLVIGGLSSRVVRRNERGVPFIRRVPLLGLPFRGRQTQATTNHLLIFVSPTSVDLRNLEPPMMNALEFWRYEKWRHREAIDEEFETLEDEF